MKLGEYKNLKTKFFLGKNISKLEKEVNEFLSDINPNDLIDVKYEMTNTGAGNIYYISYSVIIIYKEY